MRQDDVVTAGEGEPAVGTCQAVVVGECIDRLMGVLRSNLQVIPNQAIVLERMHQAFGASALILRHAGDSSN